MLTETEIFSQLRGQLSEAAEACDHVAARPESGIHFIRLRRALKLAEGCCRQAAMWRGDARWLEPGVKLEQAHQIARDWLHRPTLESKRLFVALAAALRQMTLHLAMLETAKTGRSGSILPKARHLGRKTGAPVQVPAGFHASSGGVLLPAAGA